MTRRRRSNRSRRRRLALLSGDEAAAQALAGTATQKRETIRLAFSAYDHCGSGTLSIDEVRGVRLLLPVQIRSRGPVQRSRAQHSRPKGRRRIQRPYHRSTTQRNGHGTRSIDEAQALFRTLARSLVEEIGRAGGGGDGANETTTAVRDVARANARRILDDDDKRGTIDPRRVEAAAARRRQRR